MDEQMSTFSISAKTLATIMTGISMLGAFGLYIIRNETNAKVYEVSVRVAVLESNMLEIRDNLKESKSDLQYIRGRIDGMQTGGSGNTTNVNVPPVKVPVTPRPALTLPRDR